MPDNETFFRQILDESSDPIFSFFPDGTYRYINKAFAKGVNRPVEDIQGRRIWDVFPKDEADRRFAAVKKAFETGQDQNLEVKVQVGDAVSWYLTTVHAVTDEAGAVTTVVCVSKNITDRKQAEQQLLHYATVDELTGVVNRRAGLSQFEKLLELQRHSLQRLSLMYGDIDGLKHVNDTYGHAAGDQLILACCTAITKSLRKDDALCRLGGDEFLILLPDCDEASAQVIENRIEEHLEQFNREGHYPWKASISLGALSHSSAEQVTSNALLQRLDGLMYQNKRSRKAL